MKLRRYITGLEFNVHSHEGEGGEGEKEGEEKEAKQGMKKEGSDVEGEAAAEKKVPSKGEEEEKETKKEGDEVKGDATREERVPLMYSLVEAAQYGDLERCRHLVEIEGQDGTKGDNEGVTPLHWAAINNRLLVAK